MSEGWLWMPMVSSMGVSESRDELITIDLDTGRATSVGSLGVNLTHDVGLGFDSDGRLWMSAIYDEKRAGFFVVDPATGTADRIRDLGGGAFESPASGMASASVGQPLYGAGPDSSNKLVTIDSSTGTLALVGPLVTVGVGEGGIGLDFDASGTLWGVQEHTGTVFTLDTATGRASKVATTLPLFEGLAIAPVVPINPQ